MKEIQALTGRVLPGFTERIHYEWIPAEQGMDVYEIVQEGEALRIRGNSQLSMAAGLGWYLEHVLLWDLGWCGGRREIPEQLPDAGDRLPCRRVIEQKYRSYFNYCTFQYSAAWWDWERWQEELDRMALHGINLPLMTVGLEAVWYETLLELGFSDEEARSFLCGPAFLAWQWMTNLEGFLGPLPMEWIESHRALGKRILETELAWGMQPIQQGFTGFVPRLCMEKMPEARIRQEVSWCGFPGTAQLDPTDPAFYRIGRLFLQKQKELFGSHGYYAADPFHEGEPPEKTEAYLHAVGDAIRSLLLDFDPDAVWVAQSWSIRKEIVTRMEKDRLLVLDLNGERAEELDGFWGYPFVTGNLHNFGGRTNLHGDLRLLSENAFAKLRKKMPNVCGTGLFMEGIEQNPVYYNLAFQMLTEAEAVDLKSWLKEYTRRRYGADLPEIQEAWRELRATVYAPGTNGTEKSSIFCARPAVRVKKSGPNDGFHVPYGNERLEYAFYLLLKSGVNETVFHSDGWRYDIVDLLRQILSNRGQRMAWEAAEAFLNRERGRFIAKSNSFVELISDVDRLLQSRPEFRLDTWLEGAQRWGRTEEEKQYYRQNAAVLLTLWGTKEETEIFDYAWREWAGLLSGFYRERWKRFYRMLEQCLEGYREYEEETLPRCHGREAFRANAFYEELADWEDQWTKTVTVSGKRTFEVEEVTWLAQKYHILTLD